MPNGNTEFSVFVNNKHAQTDANMKILIDLTLTPEEIGTPFFCYTNESTFLFISVMLLTHPGFLFFCALIHLNRTKGQSVRVQGGQHYVQE